MAERIIADRYRLLEVLGSGGFGTVWRAEDLSLGRPVALKILAPGLVHDPIARARFRREARLVARLSHPFIAAVYDSGEGEDLAFVVQELVDGGSLRARLAAGPLTIPEAVRVARSLAEALAHAHGQDVLHRDLSAGNVLFTREGGVKLVDFGMAVTEEGTISRLTATGAGGGTPAYIPPEVLRGERADARSDLYSLTVVLYEMLTGRPPFGSGGDPLLLDRVLHQSAPLASTHRPQIPDVLDRFLDRGLAKRPTERIQDARAYVAELDRIATSGALARPPGPWVRLRRRARQARLRLRAHARQYPARVYGGLAAGLLLAAMLGLVGLQRAGLLPGESAGARSLAVLPFENTSTDSARSAYLADGLCENLVDRLGQVEGIRVLPWLTTARHAGRDRSDRETARELGVDVLVTGRFERRGSELSAMVTVVDGRSGFQIRSRRFTGRHEAIFEMQQEIALWVVQALPIRLDRGSAAALARDPTRSAEAYEFFLRGADQVRSGTLAGAELGLSLLQRAVELDSTLAEAHVGIGAVYTDRYFRRLGGDPRLVEQAAERFAAALRHRPGLGSARRGLVRTLWLKDGAAESILGLAQEAALDPRERIDDLLIAAEGYTLANLPEAAVPYLERALELDPSNPSAAFYHVIALAWSGRAGEAITAGRSFLERHGEDAEVLIWMGHAAVQQGDLRMAEAFLARAVDLSEPGDLRGLGWYGFFVHHYGSAAEKAEFCARWQQETTHYAAHQPGVVNLRITQLETLRCSGDTAGVRRELHRLAADRVFTQAQVEDFSYWVLDEWLAGDRPWADSVLRQVMDESSLAPVAMYNVYSRFLPPDLAAAFRESTVGREIAARKHDLEVRYVPEARRESLRKAG